MPPIPEIQAQIQARIDELTGAGRERGLQVAAYYKGDLVVDAWSGALDAASGRRVDGESLFLVFSCSKGITATLTHLLAEQGLLDYDAPVARYWPQFAQNGKQEITLRQVLTHASAVPQMPEGTTPESICDWEWATEQIAALTPLWEPGTRTGYHAITMGWILGEVAQRVTGKGFAELIRDSLCLPLGINSLFFGVPEAAQGRVATLEDGPPAPDPPPGALILRAAPASLTPSHDVYNRADVVSACIPSANCITNARSLARLYAGLAGVQGVPQILPERRIRVARTLQTTGVDLVLGGHRRKALGYFLGDLAVPLGFPITTFGHPGAGGCLGYADPAHQFSFAFTHNRVSWVDPVLGGTMFELSATIRAALGFDDHADLFSDREF